MANVTWESPQLLGTEYIAKVDQFGTGSLMFEKIYPSHEGEYKCTGANKVCPGTNKTEYMISTMKQNISTLM